MSLTIPTILSTMNYIPHGICLLWQPGLLWLHVSSDIAIALAYFTIPFALLFFVSKRRDVAFRGIFVLSGAFILACGTTHIMGVVTLWYPVYWTDGFIKLITACVSICTACVMWYAMPVALALPSPERLERANRELEAALADVQRHSLERLRAEDMLRQSEKMRAMGQLTGGIAHDFNNRLGVIIGCTEFLLDRIQMEPEEADLAHEILNSALGCSLLTRRLLAVGRKQPLQPQSIDLNALLVNHVEMLRRTLCEAISVRVVHVNELWLTSVDPPQVVDVLLNLALNARDAMPDGGSLTLEASNVHLEAGDKDTPEGDYVVLSVKDTGVGMSHEVAKRAVEPFFTTKSASSGSGLGLSMAYGFAKQSGGHLEIESQVGVGTTIRLYLPRAVDGAVASTGAAPMEGLKPRGTEVVLLVDDNQTLLEMARRHLGALGYKTVTASSGRAALAILDSREHIDLLFTDIVMPGSMSGYKLAERARNLQPDLRVLFTTGYASDSRARDGTELMLNKPYDRQALARAVRKALDSDLAEPAMQQMGLLSLVSHAAGDISRPPQ